MLRWIRVKRDQSADCAAPKGRSVMGGPDHQRGPAKPAVIPDQCYFMAAWMTADSRFRRLEWASAFPDGAFLLRDEKRLVFPLPLGLVQNLIEPLVDALVRQFRFIVVIEAETEEILVVV